MTFSYLRLQGHSIEYELDTRLCAVTPSALELQMLVKVL
jgi:hypothetical protein